MEHQRRGGRDNGSLRYSESRDILSRPNSWRQFYMIELDQRSSSDAIH